MKTKNKKIGRPTLLKKPVSVTLSLNASDKVELDKQVKLSGSASISHYLRKLIAANKM